MDDDPNRCPYCGDPWCIYPMTGHDCPAKEKREDEQERKEMTMDPDANLEEQLQLTNIILNNDDVTQEEANRLAELVEALDAWIHKGGCLPKQWRRTEDTFIPTKLQQPHHHEEQDNEQD